MLHRKVILYILQVGASTEEVGQLVSKGHLQQVGRHKSVQAPILASI